MQKEKIWLANHLSNMNRMTGICAIYGGIVQTTAATKSTILSLTSTTFRCQSKLHVRRNSMLACANQTQVSSDRKLHALSSPFNISHSAGRFLLTVSLLFIFRIFLQRMPASGRNCEKIVLILFAWNNLLIEPIVVVRFASNYNCDSVQCSDTCGYKLITRRWNIS